jgi:hypothetical protein
VTAGRIKKVCVSTARKEGEKQKEEMWRSGAEEIDEVCAHEENCNERLGSWL